VQKSAFARWRANFFAGLALVLPAVVTVWLVVWIFRNISSVTDTLLFFLPGDVTHADGGRGAVRWYWSLLALVLAALLISAAGRLARFYVGKRIIQLADQALLRVPLINKIYGTVKQVNEAFAGDKKSSFKQVVMVEFPQPGHFSVGFVTGHPPAGLTALPGEKLVNVFIPTTPNPTSGFLVMVPETSVRKLDMPVSEGIKFIISLGAIAPESGAK
jgi:uncharacterized membrane protein